jgi:hypothetical protein
MKREYSIAKNVLDSLFASRYRILVAIIVAHIIVSNTCCMLLVVTLVAIYIVVHIIVTIVVLDDRATLHGSSTVK